VIDVIDVTDLNDLARVLVQSAANNASSNHRLHAACVALDGDAYLERRPSFFGSIHANLDLCAVPRSHRHRGRS
jgi:uncharacterized damage-inducible protein DinB